MKAFIAAALFGVLALGTPGTARASYFCPSDVYFMTPWSFSLDAPAAGAVSTHYFMRLQADAPGALSGHVILATADAEYTVPFDVQFHPDADANSDGFASDGSFVTLPKPGAVQYAWVTDVTTAAGKTKACPIFPYTLPTLSAADRRRMAPPHPPAPGVHIQYDSAPATFFAALPPVNCPQPNRPVQLKGDIPHLTNFYDPSITGKPIVTGIVAVGPEGNSLGTALIHSSGSAAYDTAGRQIYDQHKYLPQLFHCTPVNAYYYFAIQFRPG